MGGKWIWYNYIHGLLIVFVYHSSGVWLRWLGGGLGQGDRLSFCLGGQTWCLLLVLFWP